MEKYKYGLSIRMLFRWYQNFVGVHIVEVSQNVLDAEDTSSEIINEIQHLVMSDMRLKLVVGSGEEEQHNVLRQQD